jgi:hypothetical protein
MKKTCKTFTNQKHISGIHFSFLSDQDKLYDAKSVGKSSEGINQYRVNIWIELSLVPEDSFCRICLPERVFSLLKRGFNLHNGRPSPWNWQFILIKAAVLLDNLLNGRCQRDKFHATTNSINILDKRHGARCLCLGDDQPLALLCFYQVAYALLSKRNIACIYAV